MKVSRIPIAFFLAFLFILLFVTQGNNDEESNEIVIGSANLTDAGRKGEDHDCEKKRGSDKCSSREGGQIGKSDSEGSVFESEDYIYTQSLNP